MSIKVGDQAKFHRSDKRFLHHDDPMGYNFGTVIKVMRIYALVERRTKRWKVPIEELSVIDG